MNLTPQLLPNVLLLGLVSADLGSCAPSVTREVTAEMQHTYPLTAEGRVQVENPRGAIWIAGWDREEVRLEAVKRAGDPAQLEAITITVDSTPDRIAIRTTLPQGQGRSDGGPAVDYTLRVPRRACLEKIVTGRGAVTLQELAGPVVATSVNGSVTADRTRGNLKLTCVNGRTVARVSTLLSGQTIEVETVNGSTMVILPAGVGADVFARVVNGSLTSEFPLPITPDFPAGTKLEGRLGSGGAKVTAHTVNGSVRIGRQP